MPNYNTNTTVNTAATTALNRTYYDRNLLETAKTKFVYATFGQKKPIPKNNGKTVEFRRYNLFDVDTVSLRLTEGVTPDGQSLSQSTIQETVKQYGSYVEISDLLQLTAYDPVINDSAMLLGEQLGTCIEWVTRDAMLAGASDQFAGGKASKSSVTASDKLTVAEIRKAVRTLKKNKARPFTRNGRAHFVCICDPDSVYDLQNDALWQDTSKYSNAEQIYAGELGRLFGVVFVESTEGAVDKQSVLNAVSANVTSGHAFVLANAPTVAEAAYLVAGNAIKAGALSLTIASYDAATKTVTVNETFSATDKLDANDKVWSEDAGAPDASTKKAPDIHHTLIFGDDAYGVIDVAGSGAMRTIIKPQGTVGGDPLDQKSTVGAKVTAYAAKVLNPLWILDVQHTVSD